jgi:hypothetical protein
VVSSRNPSGEDLDALNIGIGCNNSVTTSLSTTFNYNISHLNCNMYYVFINVWVIRHMTSSFVRIFTGAFVPIYVGIWTSFSH